MISECIRKIVSTLKCLKHEKVAYCTKCNSILSEQLGFYENDGTWTCLECGQLLYGGKFKKLGKRYKDILWYCDDCNAFLNSQKGFDDRLGSWECQECSYINKISDDEIYEVDIDVQAFKRLKDYQSMSIMFDNNVRISISDSWERIDAMPDTTPGTQVFCMTTENSECIIIASPTDIQNIMPINNPQEVINGIREVLGEKQALIEVKSVCTNKTGLAYYIIKTPIQPHGVEYMLIMDLITVSGAIHIHGFFTEAGITGLRDSVVYGIERKRGNVGENFKGWLKDPYDDKINREYVMNLSEYEKYDDMFPQHPLSVARTFVKSLDIL